MTAVPFRSYWDACRLTNEHGYSSARIGIESRLLSEIHQYLQMQPMLTPLSDDNVPTAALKNRSKRHQRHGDSFEHDVQASACRKRMQERVAAVRTIMQEMRFLPQMLEPLSDDDDDDDDEDEDCTVVQDVSPSHMEVEIANADEPEKEIQTVGTETEMQSHCTQSEIETHALSMPSFDSFLTEEAAHSPRRTTIEVVLPDTSDEEDNMTDSERMMAKLKSSQQKYESVRRSRGQYIKKREQRVNTMDETTLLLLQEASRGFAFKVNQVLESTFDQKLDPKTFVPQELLSGVFVHLKDDLSPGAGPTVKREVRAKPRPRLKRAGSVCSMSSSSSCDSAPSTPKPAMTRFSLTHLKAKVLRIDHSIQESMHVYNQKMKGDIDRADQVQEVIRLRQLLRQKEAALRLRPSHSSKTKSTHVSNSQSFKP